MSGGKLTQTPLDKVGALGASAATKLKALWITTAEELVAQGATPDGKKRLAAVLGLSAAALDQLMAKVKAVLGPEKVKALEEKVPDDRAWARSSRPAERGFRWPIAKRRGMNPHEP